MIDLHVHTTASDGQYRPAQIMQKAADLGINTIAITDHDTVAGLEEGRAEAEKLGINFVPGIEMNINGSRGEFHLLGLGLERISTSLQTAIDNLQKNRVLRNEEMIAKMRADGVDITLEELTARFPDTVIGRPHIAAMLVEKGLVRKRQQAFDKYLAKGRPWYCERVGTNLDEAIIAIRESGGIPVIAHPMSLYLSWGKLPAALQDIYERGVMGLEAFHPGARMTDCLRLEECARKIGYFITAASDFHGEKVRADRKLGHTCNNKVIEDKFWTEELGPALERVQKN
ncbi:MAG: PHP domain-containing protein [Treponema sp.]|nr:PHP domain-containing protein [Treponema sp.]